MSPSSSPACGLRRRLRRARPLAVAAVFAALLVAGAHAQQQGLHAVLLHGPQAVRDLLMFPPNALAGQAGEYLLPEMGEARVSVLYTRESLVLPPAWQPRVCGSLRLLEVTGLEPYSLCYAHPEGAYTLFFSFPDAVEEALRCRFVNSFVPRFQVLRGLVKDEQEVPFPGVFELIAR